MLIIMVLVGGAGTALPQVRISGQIDLDTTNWRPIVYLSEIKDLSQLHSISFSSIIDSSNVTAGTFSFSTESLPNNDHLYRIHLSKKEDPPASLIIGGKDQNHFFIIARKGVDINISISPGSHLLNNLRISGYPPNDRLMEINGIVGLLDTLNFFGSPFSREYINEAVSTGLRHYADTCSNSLVSDYARYLSGGQTQKVKYPWIWIFAVVILFLIFVFPKIWRNRINKKPVHQTISELSIQERKIFSLLKEGKSNKEIADECAISVSTVKSHVNSIYSKLGIKARKEILDYRG